MSTYNVVVTAIVQKDNKVLITKRHESKKKWPNLWTVPGGNLEDSDFWEVKSNQCYHILEKVAQREVKEETGIEIQNIKYLCNLAIPGCVIISLTADWLSGDVVLQETECTEYAWVSKEDLDDYSFVPGVKEEICLTIEQRGIVRTVDTIVIT